MADIPNLLQKYSAFGTVTAFVCFDSLDARKLREVRSAAFKAVGNSGRPAAVRDGKVFELYVRDELPESTAAAY